MKIRAAFPVLAVLCMAQALSAQASNAPASTKVGVINIQAAIAGTAEGKQAAAELQSQFSPRTAELQNMQRQIQDLTARLQNGQTTLSDEEKARLQRQYEQQSRLFQRKQQEFQDDSNDAQQDVVNRIGRKMIDVIDKYSKENNYAVILDESSQQTPVIYAANQIDVTQDIIRIYDQSYPVKTATSASPAAPKPAPKPASTPNPAAPATKPQP
jgi:outer membrane protein